MQPDKLNPTTINRQISGVFILPNVKDQTRPQLAPEAAQAAEVPAVVVVCNDWLASVVRFSVPVQTDENGESYYVDPGSGERIKKPKDEGQHTLILKTHPSVKSE